ncbi:unnamed protein product [Pocillopora meandrina]|uniref:Secreted protein n=1 Tax=Pocillopora meandrina TaxID=46732 RepID=A0AAU9VYK6_9CNID|nr:unnamed protein product [Pocillopora meandrina]
MNTIILALEGLILVTCFFRAVDGFSPYMTKPKGDVSGPDDRQIKRHPSRYYQIEKEGRKRETDAETILQNGGDSQVRTRKKRRSFSYLML